jgi:hypothetical protein
MKIRIAFAAAVALLLPLLACDKTYPVTFVCEPDGGASCPPGDPCPVVPVAPDACGDVPALGNQPPTPVDMGRPLGCRIGLPYGNSFYGDTQQFCICSPSPGDPTKAAWQCPV